MNVPLFNQRDSLYAGVKLDNSPYYLNDYGCAVTSVAMVLKYYGKNTDPVSLNNDLTGNGGIDSEGLIHWNKISELYPDITCDIINCGSEPAPLAFIDECLNNNFPVIVETRFGQDESAMHFVVLTKKNGEYTMNDPWFGDTSSFNQRYGDPSRWIYSLIIYKGKAGGEKIELEKDVFENLVRKSSLYDTFVQLGYDDPNKIKQVLAERDSEIEGLKSQIRTLTDFNKQVAITLRVTDQPSEILGEITKLLTLEDRLYESEKNLETCRSAFAEYEKMYQTCDTDKTNQIKTIRDMGIEIERLSGALHKVKISLDKSKIEITRLKSLKNIENMSSREIIKYLFRRIGK